MAIGLALLVGKIATGEVEDMHDDVSRVAPEKPE